LLSFAFNEGKKMLRLGNLIIVIHFFLISFLAIYKSYAADLQAIKENFEVAYFDSCPNSERYKKDIQEMYVGGRCRRNIEHFILSLKNKKIDLSNSYLLMIKNISSNDQGYLICYRCRQDSLSDIGPGPSKQWSYHAVLLSDGVVFDFDYTNRPTPVEYSFYFQDMFTPFSYRSSISDQKKWWNMMNEDWRVVLIPAKDVKNNQKIQLDRYYFEKLQSLNESLKH